MRVSGLANKQPSPKQSLRFRPFVFDILETDCEFGQYAESLPDGGLPVHSEYAPNPWVDDLESRFQSKAARFDCITLAA